MIYFNHCYAFLLIITIVKMVCRILVNSHSYVNFLMEQLRLKCYFILSLHVQLIVYLCLYIYLFCYKPIL
jgi:hypothetical protein